MAPRVGITQIAHHVPPGRMSAEELARRTGLSVEKIHADMGLHEKPVGNPGDSALDFAVEAGRALIAGDSSGNSAIRFAVPLGIDPASIDLLIYASGSMTDHPLWWGVYKLHERLGLRNARLLELQYGCIGSLHALEAAKNYMVANPRINRAVVIGAEGFHFSEHVGDYTNPHNEPMFILADGAAAALLESDRVATLPNALGEFAFMVDSSHHAAFTIPAGGAKQPTTPETVAAGLHRVQLPVQDPQALRRFGLRYIANYLTVIDQAMQASGHAGKPDFVISNQLKLPLMRILLAKLGLDMAQTAYTMPKWGHVGAADILLSLGEAMRDGQLKSGQTAAIVSSGTGFSWGAATLEVL
jgi:3-oxoacyl-[acyl-carrier-protein] synthase-3